MPKRKPSNQASVTNNESVITDSNGGKDALRVTNGENVTQAADRDDGEPVTRAREETKSQAWERLRREGRAAGLNRRAAIAYAAREVERLYPSNGSPGVAVADPPTPSDAPRDDPPADPVAAGDGLAGLADLPVSWPELPANAVLAAEVQWVQANRLRVRQGDGVDLSRALSPAPSHAALSWLETSIVFPSKWADITARATQNQEDEREHVRRERASIEEVRSILAEMLDAQASS